MTDTARLVAALAAEWQIDAYDTAYPVYVRVACEGGSDEHWQVRLDPDSEMPDLVWTAEGGIEVHPDGQLAD